MDTGYPALITEPLASPDPKAQKPAAVVNVSEAQVVDPNPESSGTPATKTPAA